MRQWKKIKSRRPGRSRSMEGKEGRKEAGNLISPSGDSDERFLSSCVDDRHSKTVKKEFGSLRAHRPLFHPSPPFCDARRIGSDRIGHSAEIGLPSVPPATRAGGRAQWVASRQALNLRWIGCIHFSFGSPPHPSLRYPSPDRRAHPPRVVLV